MKKYRAFGILEYLVAAALCFMILTGASGLWARAGIAQRVIRLHVIGNSDSRLDQAVKLQVRNAVLGAAQELCADAQDEPEAYAKISQGLEDIEDAANAVLREKGFSYRASASLEESRFPTKFYDTFALPAGTYTSLTVRLGEAEGQNWWCVVFPSLCTSAQFEQAAQTAGLNGTQVEFIRPGNVEIRFRIVEFIEKLSEMFGKR